MKSQTPKISLRLLLIMVVGVFLPLAVGRNFRGQEVETIPPASPRDSSTSSEQGQNLTTDVQDPTLQSEPLPDELWELLQQQAQKDQGARAVFAPLKPLPRIGLLSAAGLILLAAVIVCRRLSSQEGIFARESNIFLLFGFFGSIAAMFVACASVGNLYLHLAAAICTIVSGFSITAFLTPQFTLTRRWLVGPERPSTTQGDNNDTTDQR